MRFILIGVFALGLGACSDVPDRGDVEAMLEVTAFGFIEGGLRMIHQGDDEQIQKDVDELKTAMVDCMYENTDIEDVNWAAVDEVATLMREVYEDNRERFDDNLSGRSGVLDQALKAHYDGEKPSESEQERLEEGMQGFQKWSRASQDCVREKSSQIRQRIREQQQ